MFVGTHSGGSQGAGRSSSARWRSSNYLNPFPATSFTKQGEGYPLSESAGERQNRNQKAAIPGSGSRESGVGEEGKRQKLKVKDQSSPLTTVATPSFVRHSRIRISSFESSSLTTAPRGDATTLESARIEALSSQKTRPVPARSVESKGAHPRVPADGAPASRRSRDLQPNGPDRVLSGGFPSAGLHRLGLRQPVQESRVEVGARANANLMVDAVRAEPFGAENPRILEPVIQDEAHAQIVAAHGNAREMMAAHQIDAGTHGIYAERSASPQRPHKRIEQQPELGTFAAEVLVQGANSAGVRLLGPGELPPAARADPGSADSQAGTTAHFCHYRDILYHMCPRRAPVHSGTQDLPLEARRVAGGTHQLCSAHARQ
jgi:hypothetical protein